VLSFWLSNCHALATSLPVFLFRSRVLQVLPCAKYVFVYNALFLSRVSLFSSFLLLQGHTGDITCLAFIADSYVVSGSRAGQLMVHGLQQGTLTATMTLKADAGAAVWGNGWLMGWDMLMSDIEK
jgi:hypothetical protein